MKIFIQNLSMRRRILLMTTLILFGFLLSQVFSFWYALASYFNKDMKQSTERIAKNITEDIDDFSSQVKAMLSTVYMDSEFMQRMDERDFDYKDRQYAHELLTKSTMLSDIQVLYIYDREHNLVSSYRKNTSIKSSLPYNLYEQENEEGKRLKEYIETEDTEFAILGYEDYAEMCETVRYVLRIYQDRGKREIGYFVCDVAGKDIIHNVERNLYKDEQHLWLETQNRYPVILTENEKTVELVQECQSQKKISSEVYYEFLSDRSKYAYQVHILSSTSYFEKNAKEFVINMSGVILFLFLIWGSVLSVTSKKMTQKLTEMTNGIEQIKNGNMTIRFENLYNDELGKLGEQFNHMMDEIENYIYREYKSRIVLNDAKYYALQAQINPHFLFNTLNTMAGIAGAEHCDTVKRMCEILSEIFRYNIAGNMDKKFVTLGEEMTHVKNYMYIVEMRTMNGIQFYDEVPEHMRKIRIPKLSIQPLVENSVNHGLKNKRGEKYICVKAEEREGSVYIHVMDNGVGMDVSEKEKYFCEESEMLQKHTSIGLQNINERIHFLFGNEYGLTLRHSDLMEVIVKIPYTENGGEDENVSYVDRRG